ncbi:MAG: DUF5320 domain-containing protein [Promethearchaeota archaeon]
MYNVTGLPGWLRFGFSPGWIDRSPTGLPPTAQWIIQSGQLPQFQSYLQTVPRTQISPTPAPPAITPLMPELSKEQEKQMLEKQEDFLGQQLEAIKKRLSELTEE